jgi:hypothetical protein
MGLPYNLRVNVAVPFPALVTGAAGIKVTKTNGIWTIQPDFSTLNQVVPPVGQYPVTFVEVWNSTTGIYSAISLTNFIAQAAAIAYTVVTAAGTYNVLTADVILLINKTVPAANTVQLPFSVTRNGAPIVIKDGKGDGATNLITILPAGAELIDGLASVQINSNYGGFRLWPLTTGGWFLSP